MNQDATPFDKLVDCFLVHYQFETIHPFNDGNGRIGRVLLALMLQQKCGFSKPWLYMSEFFEQHREEYFQKLFNVSAKADWSSWTRFCLEGTVHQAKDTIGRCRVLLKTREEFRSRLSNSGEGSIRLGQILDDIFHTPFIRVADLAKRLNVTYPTAKKDLERLNELGMLHELPDIYPKTYYAPDVFKIAYEKLDD